MKGHEPKGSEILKQRLILVHWNDDEWALLAKGLMEHGFEVSKMDGSPGLKLKDPPETRPLAVLISLRRLPSHGREVAEAVWHAKWAREAIRLVFVDGTPDAIDKTRQRFPSALYTTYETLPSLLADG